MIFEYLKKRLSEKTTKASIVAAIVALIAKFTGVSGEILTATEEIVGGLVLLAIAALPSPKISNDTAKSTLSASVAAFLLLFLSACGGNGSVLGGYLVDIENPQSKAGFNETLVEWETVQTEEGKHENQINRLYLLNGQESGTLTLELALSDGSIYKFKGGDIKAFQAFQTRAEVEQAIANVLGDLATPENIANLANLFAPGAVP